MTPTERAEAGGAYLDEHWPPWWQEVDPDTLDVGDCAACVLGQIAARALARQDAHEGWSGRFFARGLHLVGLGVVPIEDLSAGAERARNRIADLGFALYGAEAPALTAAFRHEIAARRAAAGGRP